MMSASRRANIERLLEKTPDDPFLLYGLALCFFNEGDEVAGVARLHALTTSHPDYHAAHFQLGQFLGARGDVEEARQWLDRGSQIAARLGDAKAANEMADFRDAL